MADNVVFDKDLGELLLIPRWSSEVEDTAARDLAERERGDGLFSCAINFMRDSLSMPDCFPPEEVDKAARSAMDFALGEGDRLAWTQLLGIYRAFVARRLSPPQPLLEGLSEVFEIFSVPCSMEVAFGLNNSKNGRPSEPYQQRNTERCNAIAVCLWMDDLGTGKVQEAARKWAEMQDLDNSRKPDSVRTIVRHYDKHKNSVWLAETLAAYRRRRSRSIERSA